MAHNSSDEDIKDVTVDDLDIEKASSPDGGRRRLGYLDRMPTLPADSHQPGTRVELSRQQHRTLELERKNSINMFTGPTKAAPGSKMPAEFRTLSIHVSDTKDGKHVDVKQGKKQAQEIADLTYHKQSTDEILQLFGVSPKQGLEIAQASRRLSKYGKNIISPPPRKYFKKWFFYFFGGFGSLLFVASIVCFIAWKPLGSPPAASNLALAVVLLIVILIQAIFNAWQDWSTSRVMASISGLLPADVLVLRDGNTVKVPAAEIVPGDLVRITLGSKIPADLRLLEVSSDLRFDRSILTGESDAVPATLDATEENFMESRNVALQGTLCVSGAGTGICLQTGDLTVFGRIAKLSSRERPQRTTLENEILRFVTIIASLAFVTALLIVILWGAWLKRDYPDFLNVPNLLIDVISVAVAFIPEGLPICLTLSLTVIAGAMKKNKVLCKSLSTVETLGAVDAILSDKTGTLTKNQMHVQNIATISNEYTTVEARDCVVRSGEEAEGIKAMTAITAICNDAQFEPDQDQVPLTEKKVNGDATDTGLLRFSEYVIPVDVNRSNWVEVYKLAFNSKNKFAAKLVALTESAQNASVRPAPISPHDQFDRVDLLLLVKGAPDVLLKRCTKIYDSTGRLQTLDANAIAKITSIQEKYASLGQRVLLLAKKIIPGLSVSKETRSDLQALEDRIAGENRELCVVGLAALVDPPRDDTASTVATCRAAGIRFAMVTGDFKLTAAAIARQVGIITQDNDRIHQLADLPREMPLDQIVPYNYDKEEAPLKSLVLSGSDLLVMTESQWDQALSYDELVFARTTPEQKLRIVRAFQAKGSTVAVTGDGVNDAPALKQADVGIAIAGGSEVAMEAADLVLLADFSAIVDGIRYGRLVFDNLKKVILYLLPAGSWSELWPVMTNVLFGLPQALSSLQMIIICVGTDVFPALSLIYEQPESDLLTRRPRNPKKDRLADIKLLGHAYLFLGMILTLCSMVGAFYWGFQQRNGIPFSEMWLKYGGYNVDPDLLASATNEAQSIYFINLVIMQWFNLLSTRTRRLSIFQQNPFGGAKTRNLYLFPAMLIALSIAVFFIYIPFFQNTFLTASVAVQFYFIPMAYGVVLLFLDESRKYFVRKYPKGFLARIAW